MSRKIALYNTDGSIKKISDNVSDAKKYCKDNNICNTGWVERSLKTGEKFYYPYGNVSKSHKGYVGKGMYVKWIDENE